MRESQQASRFDSLQWETARFVLSDLDRYVKKPERNGQMLSALVSSLGDLMVTEGSRRRLHATNPVPEPVTKAPNADPSWGKDAKRWWRALKDSAVSRYYEPSDWEFARFVAGEMSRHQTTGYRSAIMHDVLRSAQTSLLVTESSRIRVGIDLLADAATAAAANAHSEGTDHAVDFWEGLE